MTYLLVPAAGGAFVSAGFEVSDPELQPVSTAPITIPNSTIRVYILFIVNLTFTKSPKRTSTIFANARGGLARVEAFTPPHKYAGNFILITGWRMLSYRNTCPQFGLKRRSPK